jgi:hypothetical protein
MVAIPLIICAVITFLGIVISSVILAIANTVSGYLDETNYDKLSGDCENTKESIFTIVEEDLGRLRWLNGIMLAIFILLFILSCVGIYFTSNMEDEDGESKGLSANDLAKSGASSFFAGGFFLYIILFMLFGIFLVYTIFYGIMLGRINSADSTCFSGDAIKDNSELGNFNRAKNLILTQFAVCFMMLIVVSIIIGVIIFYKYRKSQKKK